MRRRGNSKWVAGSGSIRYRSHHSVVHSINSSKGGTMELCGTKSPTAPGGESWAQRQMRSTTSSGGGTRQYHSFDQMPSRGLGLGKLTFWGLRRSCLAFGFCGGRPLWQWHWRFHHSKGRKGDQGTDRGRQSGWMPRRGADAWDLLPSLSWPRCASSQAGPFPKR